MSTGVIFDIKKFSINDGPGIRTTVFLKGCPLSCWWCHNPESQDRAPEMMLRSNRCTQCGECIDDCPVGAISAQSNADPASEALAFVTDRTVCDNCGICADTCYNGARELLGHEMTVAQVMKEIERDVPFFDQSHGGVTFSGGEPLMQRRFLVAMLRACCEHDIHTVVDTSGYATWTALDSVRGHVKLFLYDLKLMDAERHIRYTGVSNTLILDNLRRLSAAGADCVVRIPFIPGVNDDEENLRATGDFLSGLRKAYPVEVMGYHEIARAKYDALGIEYRLPDAKAPSAESLHRAVSVLSEFGIAVQAA